MVVNQFCKVCGKKDEGFYVRDKYWKKVKPYIKHGNVLCLDCFCKICEENKIDVPVCIIDKW